MTQDERINTLSLLGTTLAAHAKAVLAGVALKDGYRVKVWSGVGYNMVELFAVKQHTQSTLGSISVKAPVAGKTEYTFTGTFYDYGTDGRSLNRITMQSATIEEAVAKMAGCVSPLIDTDAWPSRPGLSLPLADCRE